jgi:Protein of unknown function (DUF1553)
MEAEVVRDSILRASGRLDAALYGPDLDPEQGHVSLRRSLYFRASKEKGMTFLAAFDRARVTECYRRAETIVPQQALALANSSLTRDSARLLAKALTEQRGAPDSPETAASFIQSAFEHVLSRPATPEEQAECEAFLTEQATLLSNPAALSAYAASEQASIPPAADPHQRARENLVHVLLNHNDFVTIR